MVGTGQEGEEGHRSETDLSGRDVLQTLIGGSVMKEFSIGTGVVRGSRFTPEWLRLNVSENCGVADYGRMTDWRGGLCRIAQMS